jgi:hypothetical protein
MDYLKVIFCTSINILRLKRDNTKWVKERLIARLKCNLVLAWQYGLLAFDLLAYH